jgi:hypothetical protein
MVLQCSGVNGVNDVNGVKEPIINPNITPKTPNTPFTPPPHRDINISQSETRGICSRCFSPDGFIIIKGAHYCPIKKRYAI